jgi:hypothetical protein
MASPFITALDKTNHLQHSENGSAEYTAACVEESSVTLFFALVLYIPNERLHQLLHTAISQQQ